MKIYNLCFLGFGNVGRALWQLLAAKSEAMRADYGIEWRVTGVATRRMGWRAAAEGLDVEALWREGASAGSSTQIATPSSTPGSSASSATPPASVRGWLAAAECEVLFETTSLEPFAGQPAREHVRAALDYGAHVITANKGAIIHGSQELIALAVERDRRFLYEATVAEMPVFSLFRECLPAARLLAFSGILNSTSNIMLEEMEAGRTFAEGVARAQSLGIAETDPTYDVDGWDAAVKTCALVNVLMNASLGLEEIAREGIGGLDTERVRAARAAGSPFKLVSRAARTSDGQVVASVRPERVAAGDPLAAVNGTSLSINYVLDVLPGLTVTTHAPDLQSTAYGLLADFINAVRGKKV